MKNKRQACAALRPITFDAAVIGRDPSFIRSAHGRHVEMESGILLRKRGHLNAVDALIQAIDGGFEGAVLRLCNVQNEMKYRFARLQRTGPGAFQRGGAPLRLRFVNGWSLGGSGRKSSEAEERDG